MSNIISMKRGLAQTLRLHHDLDNGQSRGRGVNHPTTNTPNPGSNEAVNLGCICPILDNGHGDQRLGDTRGFWITTDCPLHDKSEETS